MKLNEPCSKKCLLRIGVIFVITLGVEFFIWWGLIREESVNWISERVMESPSAYALSRADDGRIIASNVIYNLRVFFPADWQNTDAKNPVFYLRQNGKIICSAKSDLIIDEKKDSKEAGEKIFLGPEDIEAEQTKKTKENGDEVFEIKIPVKDKILKYEFFAQAEYLEKCEKDFEEIKNSFLFY